MNKAHQKEERTLIIIKPDGVQRSLIGEIIQRFEKIGLKLIAMKMLIATPKEVEGHYTVNPGWKKNVGESNIKGYIKQGLEPPCDDPEKIGDMVLGHLKDYIVSGPVIVMTWQGAHSVSLVRKMTGGTEPLSSDVGTIRGDYVLDSFEMADQDNRAVRNLIHASGTTEEAKKEVRHWFNEKEIIKYETIQEKILYDTNIDAKI